MQIELQQVTVRFPDRKTPKNEVVAVDHVDLRIPDGKLVCLLGPSGCGKSTTLYAIAGLQALSEGKILFGDKDVTELDAAKREIGLVFQNYALYPHMTVRENIIFPLQNAKWSKESIAVRVLEVAKTVQIEPLLDRKPSQLSGGQQQRVAIARAIAKNPKILLMDEPLSNLDAKLRHSTREEIRRIQKATGITTIFVTHDQEEAMSISDEVVIMRDGLLQQIGKPQEVYENPANLFVATFIGSPTMNTLSSCIRDGQLLYEGYHLGRPELEDQDTVLGIRPEALIPVAEGTESGEGIPAKVLHMELLGREVLYHLLLAAKDEVTMITGTDILLAEEQDIKLRFQPQKRFLFETREQTLLKRF